MSVSRFAAGTLVYCVATSAFCHGAHGSDVDQLSSITVFERSDNLIGIADSATEGVVGSEQLSYLPLSRVGEILETVPGLILTQHSGSGKANQYFLRGFNLDHGTDFAAYIDDMPVNMPTHGHGQGYADVNFLIPELIGGIRYRKGPYYADEGDFSAAGAVHIDYLDRLPREFVEVTFGSNDYYRTIAGGSTALGAGNLLAALELLYSNGPWENPEDNARFNGALRYARGDAANGWHVTGMGYSSDWDSSDQIPLRAVQSGKISRFGFIDGSDGGDTHRYSLSADWHRADADDATQFSAYMIDYGLNLYSNFTYFLDDPINGDQFEQEDRRRVYGGHLHQKWFGALAGREMENTIGLQLRYDDIDSVGLFHTRARERLDILRADEVRQLSVSPYIENRLQWAPKLRTVVGLRGDYYHADVNSDNTLNSGVAADGIASPKLSLIVGPWYETEYYLNLGYGFHSNDVRGSTITVDPASGEPATKVDLLVRAKGAEVGMRSTLLPDLQTTLSAFLLDIDSELLFVGDAGNTDASRPSRRYGVEWTNYYTPTSWLTLDADFAFTTARFRDEDPAGDRIPGAVQQVIAAGVSLHDLGGVFGSVRLRYFGPRPLIEDNSIRSEATTLINAEVGYELSSQWRIALTALNIFDSKDNDIDYYYASRLPGEPDEGVEDFHFHPVEPAQIRLTLTARF